MAAIGPPLSSICTFGKTKLFISDSSVVSAVCLAETGPSYLINASFEAISEF